MLDSDLAHLYGVTTGVLNQSVRRNIARFPDDFMFRVTREEVESLRSQFVILKDSTDARGRSPRGVHRKYLPYAFTEQGVAMLSSVLRSPRAVSVNIEIMRAFVRMRQILASHADLARKLDSLEKKYDAQFRGVFEAIKELMASPPERGKFGFARDRKE